MWKCPGPGEIGISLDEATQVFLWCFVGLLVCANPQTEVALYGKNSWPDETISTWAKICFIIHILLYSNILSFRIYVLSISIYYVVV